MKYSVIHTNLSNLDLGTLEKNGALKGKREYRLKIEMQVAH